MGMIGKGRFDWEGWRESVQMEQEGKGVNKKQE